MTGTPSAIGFSNYDYTVTDSAGRTDTIRFRITLRSVFTFESVTPISQTYTVGIPIADLTLPAATGGTPPFTYGNPARPGGGVPDGLAFDPATRVLSGTPTTAQPQTSYTYTVIDSNGLIGVGPRLEITITATANVDGNAEVTHLDGLVLFFSLNPAFIDLRNTDAFRDNLMGHLRTSAVGTTQALVDNAEALR